LRLPGKDVPGDVAEIADDAVPAIRQRDAVDLPLVASRSSMRSGTK
jgi:hypothetical protein